MVKQTSAANQAAAGNIGESTVNCLTASLNEAEFALEQARAILFATADRLDGPPEAGGDNTAASMCRGAARIIEQAELHIAEAQMVPGERSNG